LSIKNIAQDWICVVRKLGSGVKFSEDLINMATPALALLFG